MSTYNPSDYAAKRKLAIEKARVIKEQRKAEKQTDMHRLMH
jgi:hypothetical protein